MSQCGKLLRFMASGPSWRQLCTAAAPKFTTVSIDPSTAIATLTLNRPPANALGVQLLHQVRNSIIELEQSKCRGIIVTSASERIFCAGLDLTEVYKADKEHLAEHWRSLQNMWLALFNTALPTAALINGHALAAGCMLATCCDYRVTLPNFIIGLNETRVGIAVPKWVINSYVNVMHSKRKAEADLIAGAVYKSEEALKVGLVDVLAENKQRGLELCTKFLLDFDEHTRYARGQTKLQFRADIVKEFLEDRERDLDLFLQGAMSEEVQTHLGNYLKQLKDKSAKRAEKK